LEEFLGQFHLIYAMAGRRFLEGSVVAATAEELGFTD